MDLWQQVQQVFEGALQHSPEKRQKFLEQECGSNQELRQEVESLPKATVRAALCRFWNTGYRAAGGRHAPRDRGRHYCGRLGTRWFRSGDWSTARSPFLETESSSLGPIPSGRASALSTRLTHRHGKIFERRENLAAHEKSGGFMAEPAVAGMADVLHQATRRFQPGDTLGAYKVLDLVGRGGMGEVYRARDTRLKRDVAIKVLPRALAADRERLSRFEQEARSAAALNHPNIISIHDMGTADGVRAELRGQAPAGPDVEWRS